MKNDYLLKTFLAPVPLEGCRVATFGYGDGEIELARDSADALIGVTTQTGTQDNSNCDLVIAGTTEVITGGPITKGNALTCDSQGRVKTATTALDRIIGMALQNADGPDEKITILIAQG